MMICTAYFTISSANSSIINGILFPKLLFTFTAALKVLVNQQFNYNYDIYIHIFCLLSPLKKVHLLILPVAS